MNKSCILAVLMLSAVATVQAQNIVFSCDFEEGMPNEFACYDLDGNTPSRSMKSYGLTDGVAWAAYTDTLTDNTAAYSGSWYKTPAQSNDWLVTSAIAVDDVRNILSWKTYALDANHPDGYAVYISEVGNKPENFIDEPVYVVAAEKNEWQQHYVSLAPWVGKSVYVAFVNNSTNCNILALDDISVYSYEHSFVFNNTTPEAITAPGVVHVTGEIKSSGFMPVEGYKLELTYDGKTTVIDRTADVVAADSMAVVEFDVDIDVALDATSDYSLTISSLGGADVMILDGSITCFQRTVLIEEGTGTWCMWCPRGAYGLELMHEKYGDAIVDVAVHGSDEMMNMPYYVGAMPYFTIGFPGCVLDRKMELIGDPYYDVDSLYNIARVQGAIGKVATTARLVSAQELLVDATVEFGKTIAEGEYSLSYIIVEDSVTGYEQSNAFGGGTLEMGGYEDLPDPIPAGEYFFANVGRKVYPSFKGDATVLTGGTPRHTPISVSWSIEMPEVQRLDQVKVIAVITETATGEVVNVHQVRPSLPEAVDSVNKDDVITIASSNGRVSVQANAPLQSVEVWSLSGQLLSVAQPRSNSYTIPLADNNRVLIVKAQTAHDVVVVKCVR
ncbi:MAG: choice-of-anchor J domain-containing protein [Bacteroidaceae bacterium]|nr:choice-of-anchor J domain-containing protein [Bacteroidaceae bacterium]